MAASMTFSNFSKAKGIFGAGRLVARLMCTRMKRQHSSWNAKWKINVAWQPKLKLLTGTSLGISYALFGFSFGKKEEEETDPLTAMYRSARLAHSRQDLTKADELYHEALKLAGSMLESKQITEDKYVTARTLMFDGLANIALQTGRVEMAEALFKETMKGCLQQGMEQDHNTMVEIALKLASIYAMTGRKEEAEEGYKFCMNAQIPKMETLEKEWMESGNKLQQTSANVNKSKQSELQAEREKQVIFPTEGKKDESGSETDDDTEKEREKDTAALLGMTLSSYGRFLLYEKRYKEALPVFLKARLYAENTLGTNSNQYIVVLNDIATLYIVTKNLSEAEQLLKEGITLSQKNKLGEGAMLYCNLGAVYLRKGQTEEAMKQCQLGLECAKVYDHKIAFKMAQACLTKGASLSADKSSS